MLAPSPAAYLPGSSAGRLPCPATHPPSSAHSHLLRTQTKVLAVYGSRDAMRSDYSLLEDKMPQSQVGW